MADPSGASAAVPPEVPPGVTPGATSGAPPISPRPFRDQGLIALSTRRPVGVSMVVLTILIFGMISLERLPRNLMPDISYPTITVRTEYSGASPVDVETRVSRRLEEVLSQVRNLRRVSSISRAETSDVILEFAWKTNMSLATMEVREKVDQAILPDGVPRPTILRYDPTLDPILQVGFFQKSERWDPESLINMRIWAEDNLERELETVDGVAAVQVRAGLERELHVHVSEAQLKARGLSMALINQRLREENLNQASGQLYEGDQVYVVRTVNEFADLEEIKDIIVKREGTVPVRLKEVAQVSWSYAEPEVLSRINGHPCVKVEIYKEADANIVEVAQRARDRLFGTPVERKALEEFRRREREKALAPPPDTVSKEKDGAKKKDEKGKGGPGGKGFLDKFLGGQPGEPAKPTFLATRLPEGTELVVMSDQSVFIQGALDDVWKTAVSGGILTMLILFPFLRNSWFMLVVGFSIPISVIATFIAMHMLDVSLNLMSLGGLALGIGMLVDNSIVVLESIFRCREEGDPPRVAAVRGAQQVAGAVTASTLTALAVFFPLVFVEGVAGQMFRDQALTVVISLSASLLVALYLIPACVARGRGQATAAVAAPVPAGFESVRRLRARREALMAKKPPRFVRLVLEGLAFVVCGLHIVFEVAGRILAAAAAGALLAVRRVRRGGQSWLGKSAGAAFRSFDRGLDALLAAYERALRFALAHRGPVLGACAAAVAVAGAAFAFLGAELIPEVHQGEFTADIRLPVGTRIERTDLVLQPLEKRLLAERQELGLASLTTTVGVEKDSVKAGEQGEHTALVLARLSAGQDFVAAEERAKARFREILAQEAELKSYKFQNPVLFTFKTPIEVEVKGYQLDVLKRVTREIEERMKRIPSLKDVKSNMQGGYPEVKLRFNREMLSRHGLSVGAVGDVIRQKVQGDIATWFHEGDRKFGMRVRLLEQDRQSVEDLMGLIVKPGGDRTLRLMDVASYTVSEGPAEIRRVGQQRAGVISANLTGMDLGRVTADVQAVLDSVDRPADFLVGFGGQKEEMDQSLQSLSRALLLAVFLVYVVMAMQFESLIQPFVIILSVPLAILGVSPVLLAFGIPLSVMVFLGMIILAGIVVNNAIVLIDCVNLLRSEGLPLAEALVMAGKVRMRPILMTTSTTVVGLLPLTGMFSGLGFLEWILGSGEGAEIRAPMAITVICGLSASTVLTLVVVPVVYSLIESRRRTRPESAHA